MDNHFQNFVNAVFTALKVVTAFSGVILVHEFGHFLAARKAGVRVETFSLGFGRKLFKMKRGDTEYAISAFPVGGYIKMAGDELNEERKGADYEFYSKAVSKRVGIVTAGPAMNYIFGFLLFVVVFIAGAPMVTSHVGVVIPGYPADKAGIQAGDKIISINGKEVEFWDEVLDSIGKSRGEALAILVERDGGRANFDINGRTEEQKDIFGRPVKRAMIGIAQSQEVKFVKYGLPAAVAKSGEMVWRITAVTCRALWGMLTGGVSLKAVSGPIGIVAITGEAAKMGITHLLYITGLISVSLGLFNLIPFPVLDGGHVLFFAIEKLRGRPVDAKVQNAVQQVAVVLLIAFMLAVSWNDITARFFK